jgi:Zn-dependent metalloprotease
LHTPYGELRDCGAIRDYRDPTLHGQPAHVDDYEATPNTQAGDWGGVHTNSGIPNHAYYLIVKNIGRKKAEQILWRALTEHLESDSGFEDYRTAMLAAARELYGDGADVDGVDDAFAAVGLDGSWEAPEQEGC